MEIVNKKSEIQSSSTLHSSPSSFGNQSVIKANNLTGKTRGFGLTKEHTITQFRKKKNV